MTRVLVVDDVPDNVKILTHILEDFDFEVVTACDGPEALLVAGRTSPDVILLDVMMPGLDGIEVCRRLKLDEGLWPVPVLLLSAREEDELVVRGLDAGARDYVSKPFNERILLARVRAAARAKADHDRIEKLNQQLVEMASIDGLTGARNRAYLREAMTRALAEAARFSRPVSVAMLDVDHFKQYNDSFGHLSGDEVLQGVVHVLRSILREADTLARYGGEEFAVVMPATEERSAIAAAERMRAAIAAIRSVQRPVTASFGVATALGGKGTPEDLLGRADGALYQAKRAGRNRVVAAGSVSLGESAPSRSTLADRSHISLEFAAHS